MELPVVTDVYRRLVDIVLVDLPILPSIEHALETTLSWMHGLGIPWAAAIVVLTLATRLTLLPLGMLARRSSFVLAALRPHMTQIRRELRHDGKAADDRLFRLLQDNRVRLSVQMLVVVLQVPLFTAFARVLLGESFTGEATTGIGLTGMLPDIRDPLGDSGVGGWLLFAVYVPLQTLVAFHTAVILTRRQRLLMVCGSFVALPFLLNVPVTLVLCGVATLAVMVLEHQLMARRMAGATLILPRDEDERPRHIPLRWGDVTSASAPAEPASEPCRGTAPANADAA